ncbi:hypothetical protein AZ20_0077 [Bordetella bronchiseptica E014]|nr:hypothetical protein AZ20_0077 [Bordetella bronchiseptica E014]
MIHILSMFQPRVRVAIACTFGAASACVVLKAKKQPLI